ncbi:hypothetical protein GH714_021802 [Hevea brasiliensis]|uniref:Uncharacterized protein n=1 Tax=Hevea brasiliensis TaxID=3981 RepID=A0A6A6MXU2_HEVBR|nr:hypothetical protein GH714_021664 [Hevea brasiliensis]KAF2317405.1 hypothetical protein GH714_021802 [Hevea brasiliensis]
MSLSLIQGYSSADEEAPPEDYRISSSSDDDYEYDDSSASAVSRGRLLSYKSVLDQSAPSNGSSGLPSALDVFSEISGPPQFLNNCVEEQPSAGGVEHQLGRHGRWRNRKEKKDLPAGVVVEAKAQLIGIHERVRSDIESNQPPTSSVLSTTQEEENECQL